MSSFKMMSPNSRVDWYPQTGFANPAAPTLAELNAGTNISGAIAVGYKLAAKDSDVDKSRTIVDEGNVDTPTVANYEAQLDFFLDPIGGTATVFTTAFNLFSPGPVQGWLAHRLGKKSTVAYAAGDIFSTYAVESDWIIIKDGTANAPISFEVVFIPKGEMHPNLTAPAV